MSLLGKIAGIICTALLPFPIIPTTLSLRSTVSSQAALCSLFLNFSTPGIAGHFQLLRNWLVFSEIPALALYWLQNSRGVDEHVSSIVKCVMRVATRLDLDLPFPFLVVPPSPFHSMLHLYISTKVMSFDNVLEIPKDFLRRSIVASPIRFWVPRELIVYRRLEDRRSQSLLTYRSLLDHTEDVQYHTHNRGIYSHTKSLQPRGFSHNTELKYLNLDLPAGPEYGLDWLQRRQIL